MEKLETLNEFQQTELVFIPIIDVSGSMNGRKIASVNEAMSECTVKLAEMSKNSDDVKIFIAPMQFSTGARWFGIQEKPEKIENYVWHDMEASGLTDLGDACKLLYDKLTVEEKGGWMKCKGGAAPIILLISDGYPTDEYKTSLDKLKTRGWFKVATKFAVALEGADKSVLTEFCDNEEAIIDDIDIIKDNFSEIVSKLLVTACSTNNAPTKNE